jgi:hypothetical protein
MMESRPQVRQLVVHLECEAAELFSVPGGCIPINGQTEKN